MRTAWKQVYVLLRTGPLLSCFPMILALTFLSTGLLLLSHNAGALALTHLRSGQVGGHKPSLLSLAFSEWWAESGLHLLSFLLLPPQHTRENIQNVLTVTVALQFQR